MANAPTSQSYVLELEMNHEFAVYSLDLKFISANLCGDLLKDIRSGRSFLADTNTPIVRMASTHQKINFVMGRTLSNETENPAAAYLKDGKVDGLRNLFSLSTEVSNGVPHYVIHRVNGNWRKIFREAPKPLSLLDKKEVEEFNSKSKRVSILREVNRQQRKDSRSIKQEILNLKSTDEMSYETSIEISIRAFTLHLKEGPNRRKEANKVKNNHPNVLGDTILIQEALLVGIPVVSSDSDVMSIGVFAGVTVKKPEHLDSGQ